jgi:hypothetical protein
MATTACFQVLTDRADPDNFAPDDFDFVGTMSGSSAGPAVGPLGADRLQVDRGALGRRRGGEDLPAPVCVQQADAVVGDSEHQRGLIDS